MELGSKQEDQPTVGSLKSAPRGSERNASMTENKIDDLDEDFQEISDEEMGGLQGGRGISSRNSQKKGKGNQGSGDDGKLHGNVGHNLNQTFQDDYLTWVLSFSAG